MTVHPQDRFRPEGGPLLHVDDAGGTGLPVLLQHGLCGDSQQTAEVFPADDRLRRITLECRGHGASESGSHSAFAIPRFAEDVAELIDDRRLAPLVIGGISMGAAVAMRLAVLKPQLVRGLVIARPAWSTTSSPTNMIPNAEVGVLLSRLPRDAARAAFVSSETARRLAVEAPDNLAALISFFDRKPSNVTAALLGSISVDGPGVTAEQMRFVMVPTLVIGTRMDSIHPLAIAEEIARLIPHARLVEITPKAKDRDRYRTEFQSALDQFLKGFMQ